MNKIYVLILLLFTSLSFGQNSILSFNVIEVRTGNVVDGKFKFDDKSYRFNYNEVDYMSDIVSIDKYSNGMFTLNIKKDSSIGTFSIIHAEGNIENGIATSFECYMKLNGERQAYPANIILEQKFDVPGVYVRLLILMHDSAVIEYNGYSQSKNLVRFL